MDRDRFGLGAEPQQIKKEKGKDTERKAGCQHVNDDKRPDAQAFCRLFLQLCLSVHGHSSLKTVCSAAQCPHSTMPGPNVKEFFEKTAAVSFL